MERNVRSGVAVVIAALAGLAVGCIDYLQPGEFGQLRYFGEIRGAAPLALLPPISDRDGNGYVLYGAPDVAEVKAFVGHAGGGWSGGCEVHEGTDRGVHGWVGRARDRAWYWSGDALVEMNGTTGGCSPVLDRDPTTGADLAFLGVIPVVHETPSRTTLVAMIQSPSDPVPYQVVVDLDLGIYTDLNIFEPVTATDVVVLGVGANPDTGEGVIMVRYQLQGLLRVEARFYDGDGNVTHIAPVAGAEIYGEDAVVGYLALSDSGLVAGLMDDARLVLLNREGGGVSGASVGMAPVGVHRWDGQLWLVGVGGGRPGISPIGNDGSIGTAVIWQASESAAANMGGSVVVMDDRARPFYYVEWMNPRTAIGAFPFLHAHSPDPYAIDTTTWLVAGPGYSVGGEDHTAVAFAPVGISYP